MPRINLLPTRALARLESARQEVFAIAGGMVFVLFALYLWHGITQNRIDEDVSKSAMLTADLTDLQKKVAQIEVFKSEAAVLDKKIAIIDKLSRSRSGPVQVLDGLAEVVNAQQRIWLTQFIEKNGQLTLEGGAMDQEDVSGFQMALEKKGNLFENIKLTLVTTNQDKDMESLKWAITCKPIYEAN